VSLPRKAFDFSNWTRIPTAEDCAFLLAAGYTTAIVGASFNIGLARQQIAVLLTAGFRIEVYAWLRHPWQAQLLQNAIDAGAGFPVERYWMDVEDAQDATGKTTAELEFDIQAGVDYLHAGLPAGIEVGIYTGDWFWDAYVVSKKTFGCRLWLANYVSDTTNLPPVPGGWTVDELVIWQHADTLPGTDFNADDDLILIEVLDMTPDETTAAIKAYVDPKTTALYLNAVQNGEDILNHGAQIAALALAFAAHVQAQPVAAPPLPDDLKARLDAIQAQQDALVGRTKAAAAALAPAGS
jgi:hypothetical protein